MLSGCSDNGKIPDPPAARAELTARLYDALQDKRYEDALAITDKLKALDPNDADLIEMHNRIVGNICVSAIQNSVDAGQLNNALEVIKKYRQQYPLMPRLRILEEEVRNLFQLTVAAQTLAQSDKIADLSAALENIAPLAAKYPQAKALRRDIMQRHAELRKMREAAVARQSAVDAAAAAGKAADKKTPAADGNKRK